MFCKIYLTCKDPLVVVGNCSRNYIRTLPVIVLTAKAHGRCGLNQERQVRAEYRIFVSYELLTTRTKLNVFMHVVDQQFSDIQKRLSQQEREYDINMYDSLTPADEPELQSLQNMGHSREDAVCIIFENRIKNNVTSSNIPSNSLGAPAPSTQSVPQRAVLPSSGPYVGNYNPMSSSNMAAAASSGAESYGFASNSSPPAHYHHNQSRQYHQLQQPQQQQQQHGAAVYTNAGIPLTRLSPHSSPQYFQQSQLLSIPPMNTPVGISRTLPLPHPVCKI